MSLRVRAVLGVAAELAAVAVLVPVGLTRLAPVPSGTASAAPATAAAVRNFT